MDALPRALFVAEVLARGLSQMVQDSFRGLSSPAKLSELASAVLVRADPEADEVEAFLRLPGGEPALVDTGHGHVRIEVAGDTREAASAAARMLRSSLETEPPVADQVSVAFWMRGECGGQVRQPRHRRGAIRRDRRQLRCAGRCRASAADRNAGA